MTRVFTMVLSDHESSTRYEWTAESIFEYMYVSMADDMRCFLLSMMDNVFFVGRLWYLSVERCRRKLGGS